MKNFTAILFAIILSVQNAATVYAADDYDCYSKDKKIWFSGKTAENRDGVEYFMGKVSLSLDGDLLERLNPSEMSEGSEPNNFEYLKNELSIHLNWYSKTLYFEYAGSHNRVAYSYLGKLICE